MSAITRFVIWICQKFDRDQVKMIVKELTTILNNPNSSVQPREPFNPEHPNYRKFKPDTQMALTEDELPKVKKKRFMSRRTSG